MNTLEPAVDAGESPSEGLPARLDAPHPAQVHSSELLGTGPVARRLATAEVARPADDEGARRVARLEEQCSRLAHELSGVARDADRRDREYQARIAALVRRLNECESELAEREARLAAVTGAYDGLRSQVEAGDAPLSAAAAVYRRELGRHSEVVDRLKARLEERGRALAQAREQIDALHEERGRLLDALEDRGRQMGQLLAQLTRGEVRDGFGMDFHSGLQRLLERESEAATGGPRVDVAASAALSEQTIVLGPLGGGGAMPLTASDGRATAGDEARTAGAARPRPGRLRRYLVPVSPGSGEAFELTGPRSYVGRGIAADVSLEQPTVSRLHSVLYLIGGATVVEDARSANGVYVNGQRVQQAVLKDGDVLAFGNLEFRFLVAISDP